LDVKTDGSLKVKRRTLVITSYETSSDSKGKIKDEEQASFSSYLITVQEPDDLKAKTGSTKAPETLQNIGYFEHGPVNCTFLKRRFP